MPIVKDDEVKKKKEKKQKKKNKLKAKASSSRQVSQKDPANDRSEIDVEKFVEFWQNNQADIMQFIAKAKKSKVKPKDMGV